MLLNALVLFFDTHEALWGYEATSARQPSFARDAWLRRLLGNLDLGGGLLAVIPAATGHAGPMLPIARFPIIPSISVWWATSHLTDSQRYLDQAGVKDSRPHAPIWLPIPEAIRIFWACALKSSWLLLLVASFFGADDFVMTPDLSTKERTTSAPPTKIR